VNPRALLPLVLLAVAACSAGDPPNPEDAQLPFATADAEGEEPERADAEDATLDALEERFEDAGVKDIRGEPGGPVTIRVEDDLTVADAAPFCQAVRDAGFPDVQVDIDHVVSPCP